MEQEQTIASPDGWCVQDDMGNDYHIVMWKMRKGSDEAIPMLVGADGLTVVEASARFDTYSIRRRERPTEVDIRSAAPFRVGIL